MRCQVSIRYQLIIGISFIRTSSINKFTTFVLEKCLSEEKEMYILKKLKRINYICCLLKVGKILSDHRNVNGKFRIVVFCLFCFFLFFPMVKAME